MLASTLSAKDCSSLFECFAGTTCSSDSPLAFLLDLQLVAFSNRSGLLLPDTGGVSHCAGFMVGSRCSSPMMWPSD